MLQCRPLRAFAPHVFTTRDLRLREDVDEWRVVAHALDVEPAHLRLIRQVHGTSIAVVRRGGEPSWTPPEADVIVSDEPDVAIIVRVADCAPILIADRRLGVVAAAHAGWRGTACGVATRAVEAMREQFRSEPSDLIAAIGPCLGQCCGEVGPEVPTAFREGGHATEAIERWFRPGNADRFLLDLPAANRDQLVSAGVPAEHVHDARLCTKTYAQRFHSYRANGLMAGRMAAAIRAT